MSYHASVAAQSKNVAGAIAHLHTPPPQVWHALHVARPDLFWLVATAWNRMIVNSETTLELLSAMTAAVCSAAWHLDPGTRSFNDVVTAFRIAQITAVACEPTDSTADIIINGSPGNSGAGITVAPRDKMLAVIVLAWSEQINWASHQPTCAPQPILTFINSF